MNTATETRLLTEVRQALTFIQSKSPEEIKHAVAERDNYIYACLNFNGGAVSPTEMGVWSENEIAQIILCDGDADNVMYACRPDQYEQDEERIFEILATAIALIS